ncbi:MAG: hypothetical protein JSW09_03610 [Pseudomonadota bacterium]|nr:MAG: hypothetical protein JSW09_03610 [Pseudomonadota bacterium]
MTGAPLSFLQQTILAKKAALADAINAPLGRLAERAAQLWPNADALDQVLLTVLNEVPDCHVLYCWDINGVEISSMIQASGPDPSWRGRDLSQRPYLKNHLPFKGIMLSSVYVSEYRPTQCITALQAVSRDNTLLGFIAADFALEDLLRDEQLTAPKLQWQQFRGDPAVRGTVFLQSREPSLFDQHIDDALSRIGILVREHAIFHVKIHFSSGRCSLWPYDDPYDYRLHSVEEIIDPDLCLAYPARHYPARAQTRSAQVQPVLEEFKALRFADETIYLRSGSLNIMNGMVGLTFSCDGSHYMPVEEFLAKDLSFWLGTLATVAPPA